MVRPSLSMASLTHADREKGYKMIEEKVGTRGQADNKQLNCVPQPLLLFLNL